MFFFISLVATDFYPIYFFTSYIIIIFPHAFNGVYYMLQEN
jgi:succinate dehydrogenase/fumarate reductase cytochrome b subunit